MKIGNILLAGALAGIFLLPGCGTKSVQPANGGSSSEQTAPSSSISSQSAESTVLSDAPRSSTPQSKMPAPSSSSGAASSSSGPAPSVESKNYDNGVETSTDGTWEAYDSSQDGYKLHVRKKGATGDKVIVNDPVLCPCLVGNWVYYFNTLGEIDKVRLDGSGKTAVCTTDDFGNLNGSTAVTAEYKGGYIRYRTIQMKSVGDTSSYPPCYYELDIANGKVTAVNSE